MTKIFLIIISYLLLVSCDPENDYYVSGKVIDVNTKKNIENVSVIVVDKYALKKKITTNNSGVFKDALVSLRKYDSIKYKIIKEGYISKDVIMSKDNWVKQFSISFMKNEFDVDFGNIVMIKE